MSELERVHITETRCGTCRKLQLQKEATDVYWCPCNKRLHYVPRNFAQTCVDYQQIQSGAET